MVALRRSTKPREPLAAGDRPSIWSSMVPQGRLEEPGLLLVEGASMRQ